jgi:hypothetical protein
MQHGKEPALSILQLVRPRIGAITAARGALEFNTATVPFQTISSPCVSRTGTDWT